MKHTTLLIGLLVGLLAFGGIGLAHAEGPKPFGRDGRRGAIVAGEVTAIDGAALKLDTRYRGSIVVQTGAQTKYRAKDNPQFSLADIEVGDTIAARGRFTGEGAFAARIVILVPDELSDSVRGKVIAVDGSVITVEDRDGNAVDIATSADTRFRVKGKPEASIDDVQAGMLLGAVGQFDASGALVAKRIVAAKPRGPRGGPVEAGRVAEVSGDALILSYPDGSMLTVTTDASTLVVKRGEDGSTLGSLSDVSEGAGIVVMGIPSEDGRSIAARVIIAAGGPRARGLQPGSLPQP
ncbi:MAG TPA: DUF5666 domain-containing protein [Anaerolineae bacterium]|nr:DUF5666 domain-containing protein [Anaerolineae bacterium]